MSGQELAPVVLENRPLDKWIPIAIISWWQTACKAPCEWTFCWCPWCDQSDSWQWWGLSIFRHMLWKTPAHFISSTRMHRKTKMRPQDTLLNYTSPFTAWSIGAVTSAQFVAAQNVPVLLCPAHSSDVTSLECSGSGSIQQRFLAPSCRRSVEQNFPGHNQQYDQHYVKKMGFTVVGEWCSNQRGLTSLMNPVHCQISIYFQWNLWNGWVLCLDFLFSLSYTQNYAS